MPNPKRSLFLAFIFALSHASAQAPPHPSPCDAVKPYDQTIQQMQQDRHDNFDPGDPTILSLHWTDGPGQVIDKRCYPNSIFNIEVSAAGRICSSFSYFMRGGFGCPLNGELMRAANFNQLLPLLEHLPPDAHRMSANSLEVTLIHGGVITARIYDRDRLPDDLIKILHLTNARITVNLPVFPPVRIWSPGEADVSGWPPNPPQWPCFHEHGGTTAISVDGTAVQDDWPQKTIHIFSAQCEKILTIPEPCYAGATYGNCAMSGEFTPDGRYFLMQSARGALMYDTKTWQPITDPAIFPQNLLRYQRSGDWTLGIGITASRQVLVWDAVVHRVLATLDGLPGDEVQSTTFSPSGAEVAVRSESKDPYQQRLTTWNTRTGEKIQEFWPPPGHNPP